MNEAGAPPPAPDEDGGPVVFVPHVNTADPAAWQGDGAAQPDKPDAPPLDPDTARRCVGNVHMLLGWLVGTDPADLPPETVGKIATGALGLTELAGKSKAVDLLVRVLGVAALDDGVPLWAQLEWRGLPRAAAAAKPEGGWLRAVGARARAWFDQRRRPLPAADAGGGGLGGGDAGGAGAVPA